jgi:hypothetical protein
MLIYVRFKSVGMHHNLVGARAGAGLEFYPEPRQHHTALQHHGTVQDF